MWTNMTDRYGKVEILLIFVGVILLLLLRLNFNLSGLRRRLLCWIRRRRLFGRSQSHVAVLKPVNILIDIVNRWLATVVSLERNLEAAYPTPLHVFICIQDGKYRKINAHILDYRCKWKPKNLKTKWILKIFCQVGDGKALILHRVRAVQC